MKDLIIRECEFNVFEEMYINIQLKLQRYVEYFGEINEDLKFFTGHFHLLDENTLALICENPDFDRCPIRIVKVDKRELKMTENEMMDKVLEFRKQKANAENNLNRGGYPFRRHIYFAIGEKVAFVYTGRPYWDGVAYCAPEDVTIEEFTGTYPEDCKKGCLYVLNYLLGNNEIGGAYLVEDHSAEIVPTE